MPMLTDILRYEALDEKGRRAPVIDLLLALLKDDYPPVTHIVVTGEDGPARLEWADGVEIVPSAKRIKVPDLAAAAQFPGDDPAEVLLARDVLDALILDLLHRRTTRVADLLLEEKEGALRLMAADVGIGAMIRRVTRGAYRRINKNAMFDWQYVEFLRGNPEAVDSGAGYRQRIGRLPAGEIARLADYIPYLHAAELLKLLPDDKAADVLEAMPVERQLQVIEELDEAEAVALLSRMSPDLATDIIGRLHVDTMKRYLSLIPKEHADRITELLRFPENSVGGVMINNMIVLPGTLTAGDAQARLHKLLRNVDFTSLVFLVDDERNRRLRGALPLREVLTADAPRTLEELMDPYLETLKPFDDARGASYKIVGGQLAAMPVTEDEGTLIGAMTIDAAIAQLFPPSAGLQLLRVFS